MNSLNRRDFLKISSSTAAIGLTPRLAVTKTPASANLVQGVPLFLSDLSHCLPVSALSKTNKKNHWSLIPYETDLISGVMIGAGSMAHAPDVTLPLGLAGWHSIYLGYWNPHHDYDGDTTIKLKLTGDPCFQPISDRTYAGAAAAPVNWTGTHLSECFFRHADLTDRDLVIGQQQKGEFKKAYVAYVKLVPLNQEEVNSIQKDRVRKDTRKLISSNDGISFLASKGCTTKEEILEQVEPYRYSDIGKVIWAFTYGDLTNYRSKIGHLWTSGVSSKEDITTYSGNKIMSESLDILLSKGLVPAQVALEHVHSMGLEFHAMCRMGIIGDIPPSGLWPAGLVRNNPHLRMLAKDGTPMEKASYAFPEVQEHMLSLIREVAEGFDVDGLTLGWIRGPQFVGYELPFAQDFKKEFGEDPRRLGENDNRVLHLRSRYVTDFVRKVRRLCQEIASQRKRKLELAAWVYSPEHNLFYGLDVDTWLKEGLLDSLISKGSQEYVKTVKAHNCKFYQSYGDVKSVLEGYKKSVDAFCSWDCNYNLQELPESWAIASRIGHQEEVEAFLKNPPKVKLMKLKTVDGLDICHTTNRGANEMKYWPPEMLPLYSGG